MHPVRGLSHKPLQFLCTVAGAGLVLVLVTRFALDLGALFSLFTALLVFHLVEGAQDLAGVPFCGQVDHFRWLAHQAATKKVGE